MSSEISERFSNRLKYIRKKLGLSQEDFAEVCDVDTSYIGRLERMERNPSLETLDRMAKGIGISLPDLLDFDKDLDLPNNK